MEGSLNGGPIVTALNYVGGELKKDHGHARPLHLNTVEPIVRGYLLKREYVMTLSALWMECFRSGGPMEIAAKFVVVECNLGSELVLHLDLVANHVREILRKHEHAMSLNALLMESSRHGGHMESAAKNVVAELNLGTEPVFHLDLVAGHAMEILRKQEHVMSKSALLMESLQPLDLLESAAKNVVVELSLDEEHAFHLNLVANRVKGKLSKHGNATKHRVQ